MHKKLIHAAIALVLVYIFFKYLLDFFMPFILGLGIALLLEPLVRFLIRRGGFKRGLASVVSIVVFTIGAISLGTWGISSLTDEAAGFIEAAPVVISGLQEQLSPYPYYENTFAQLLIWAEGWISSQSIRAVTLVPGLLIGIILVLLSAFFFLRDKEVIFALGAKHCPEWIREYVRPVKERLHKAAVGFLKSELILFSMVAGVSTAGLLILRQPYALMFGLATALLDSMPIVGSGLILWPWAAYMAFTGQYQVMAGLLVLYGIVTVIRNVLGPKILGEQIDLHPLAAIMSIFIGVKAFGPVGILAGPACLIGVKAMVTRDNI